MPRKTDLTPTASLGDLSGFNFSVFPSQFLCGILVEYPLLDDTIDYTGYNKQSVCFMFWHDYWTRSC